MLILLGEKQTTNEFGRNISPDEIQFEENQIVLDSSNVDFEFTELPGCFLFDAYKFIYCRRKTLSPFSYSYLVSPDSYNPFRKSNFYIQDVSLKNTRNAKILNRCESVFLMEDIVARLCRELGIIHSSEWWIYTAKHKSSGIRIIAGKDQCIALSRFLKADENISEEVARTSLYLKRFGLKKQPKIITVSEICSRLNLAKCDDIESVLLDKTAHLHAKLKPIFSRRKYWKNFADSKALFNSLCTGILISFLIFMIILFGINSEKQKISDIKSSFHVKNKCISIVLNERNYDDVEQFLTALKQTRMPLFVLSKVSKLCAENKIKAEQILCENGTVKIKTRLNKSEIKKLSRNKFITIEKNSSTENEFENLLEDRKSEVIICVKMN